MVEVSCTNTGGVVYQTKPFPTRLSHHSMMERFDANGIIVASVEGAIRIAMSCSTVIQRHLEASTCDDGTSIHRC